MVNGQGLRNLKRKGAFQGAGTAWAEAAGGRGREDAWLILES